MHNTFFPKLAFQNIGKNRRFYLPYFITCIFTISMFYDLLFIANNKGLSKIHGGDILAMYLNMGSWIVAIFSLIFLFYTNSFLMKTRKKELGLYNILGMSKRNIAHVLIWESIITFVVTIIVGSGLGVVISKLLMLLLCNIMKFNIRIGFSISPESIKFTLILFAVIFLITLIYNLGCIRVSKPIELLKGSNVGEKEPKSKWIITLFGVLSLGIAYYIALTVQDPVEAVFLFFIAVILVIFGTYALFISGSIVLLKLLRKNNNYYYKSKHFTSISGMLYRMKQNAAGLASICILSTMVLVMISGTVCLNIGSEDIINRNSPHDMSFAFKVDSNEFNKSDVENKINDTLKKYDLNSVRTSSIEYLQVTLVQNKNVFSFRKKEAYASNAGCIIGATTIEEYNRSTGKNVELKDGEVLGYFMQKSPKYNTIKLADKNLKLRWTEDIPTSKELVIYAMQCLCVVMTQNDFNDFNNSQIKGYGDDSSQIKWAYKVDAEGSESERTACYDTINKELSYENNYVMGISKDENKNEFLDAYGGLLFIGIFLGILFIGFTALIIYYKQISEGYDDKERFEIMQKVGMSKSEVKSTINSQVLKVFFLPLIVAVIHLAVAYKIISKLLGLLGLTNYILFMICIIGTIITFALIYFLIYYFTAKTYYKIVNA